MTILYRRESENSIQKLSREFFEIRVLLQFKKSKSKCLYYLITFESPHTSELHIST